MEKRAESNNSIRKDVLWPTLYRYEKDSWQNGKTVCGIDEVGRGSLLGPIVTVAAILKPYSFHPELKDSKKTSPLLRAKLFKWSINNCSYSIGINSNFFIDKHNIYKATQITMLQSLYNILYKCKQKPNLVLVDAMPLSLNNSPFNNLEILSFTKGESRSASIAAASIIAKVVRDNLIKQLDNSFPHYKLKENQGYGTETHNKAIRQYKASFIHRRSFLENMKDSNEEQLSLFR